MSGKQAGRYLVCTHPEDDLLFVCALLSFYWYPDGHQAQPQPEFERIYGGVLSAAVGSESNVFASFRNSLLLVVDLCFALLLVRSAKALNYIFLILTHLVKRIIKELEKIETSIEHRNIKLLEVK